jgi:hypothetical protein
MEQVNEPQKTAPKQDAVNYYEILIEWIKELERFPTNDELKAAWKHLTEQELNDNGVELLAAKLKEEWENE